ncbi:MAG: UvrD-helicase domain-containing protein, partial [Clostridiales bacterium]|nr:UvrD-helicase domain-containing protein [Clostridiales bacterium]
PVNKLLLITFTRAAAAEMRGRVAEVLKEKIKLDHDSFLKKQLRNLPDADICTIDAYLAKLLRRSYHIVGIDPAFSILSEDEKHNISQRAMKKILDQAFEKADSDFIMLCDTLGGKGAKNIHDVIMNCYQYARQYENYIDFIKSWPSEYLLDKKNIKSSAWMKEAIRSITFDVSTSLSMLILARDYALLPGGPDNYVDTIDNEIQMLSTATQAEDFDVLKESLNVVFFERLPSRSKDCDLGIVKKVQALRRDVKTAIVKIHKNPALMDMQDTIRKHKKMHPVINALSMLLLQYDGELVRIKNRYKTMDFSDLMHYALLALEDETIRVQEKARYDYVFVDEYQDTNRLQEKLIAHITQGNNLFCVGDVKQSIYSFRQAEPSLFVSRMDNSSTELVGNDHLIPLSENFRSSKAVVDFINIVFDDVMTRKTGGVDYKGSEVLKCCAQRPDDEGQNANVELTIINAEQKDPKKKLSNIEYEAIVASDIIKDVLSKPIYDGKLGTFRPAQFSDICILSHSFKPIVRTVRRILEQRGIPVMPIGESGYLDKFEIETAINILKVINNHHRDVALISAMHSPAFGFEIQELIAIRKKYNNKNLPFYKATEEYASLQEDALSVKLTSFYEKIKRYRMMSRHMPIGEFIWFMLSDTMLYDAVGALPGGRLRQQNLRLLAERADSFANTPGRSLHAFIAHIISIADSATDFEPAQNNDNSNTVQFMSIHKSKGLEFPVVILINTASQGRSDTASVARAGGLIPGVQCYDVKNMTKSPTLSHEASKSHTSFIENAEKLRVLYVALSRARERLSIIGTIGKSFDRRIQSWALPKQGELLFGKSFLDILGAACVRIEGCSVLDEKKTYSADNISTRILLAQDITHDKKQRSGAVLSAIIKAQDTPYPEGAFEFDYKKQSYVPAKTTATALLSGSPTQYENIEFYGAPDFIEANGYDAAARGTLTHTVMQFIDFKKESVDINAIIDSLIAENILPHDAKDVINIPGITRFLESDITQRIRNSDIVKKEQPFVVSLAANDIYMDINSSQNVLIQGIIDLCFMEDGAWVVVDYKTNQVTTKNTPQMLLAHYEKQLLTYAAALETLSDKKVKEAGIYLLSQKKEDAYYTLDL